MHPPPPERPLETAVPIRWAMARLPAQPLPLYRYGLAVMMAIVIVIIRVLLGPIFANDTPLFLSIIAVAVAAWYGGFGPGLLATTICLGGGILARVGPWGTQAHLTNANVLRMFLFAGTGVVLSGLTEALHRTAYAWHRAEQEHQTRILEERDRLAREIHDTLAQGFTGIVLQLEAAEEALEQQALSMPQSGFPSDTSTNETFARTREHLDRARTLARQSLAEARRAVYALRPQMLEQRNLAFALDHYLWQMLAGTDIQPELVVEGIPDGTGTSEAALGTAPALSPDAESDLLRIGLEALTNALKYAQATRIRVVLCYTPTTVQLSVSDDGRGFTPPISGTAGGGDAVALPGGRLGFGLISICERAKRIGARLELNSSPGQGTEVVVTVPRVNNG